jgi:hypothetical protein
MVLAVVALILSAVALAGPPTDTSIPPNGVYTCDWIASHPTAATLAGVSCNENMVNPGSTVSPEQVARATITHHGVSPFANGCQRVPSSGSIGGGVYAETTFEYSNFWTWNAPSRGENYYWYIKHTDGSNQTWGYAFGTTGNAGVPANVYQWKVQNETGNDPQYWDSVCYSG